MAAKKRSAQGWQRGLAPTPSHGDPAGDQGGRGCTCGGAACPLLQEVALARQAPDVRQASRADRPVWPQGGTGVAPRGPREAGHTAAVARLADAEPGRRMALLKPPRRGTETAKTVCAVSDGVEWSQGIVARHRPDAGRLVDCPQALRAVACSDRWLAAWPQLAQQVRRTVSKRV